MFLVFLLLPGAVFGQGMAGSIHGMQPVLDRVYTEMLPLCSGLIGVARGIAGFGALWYIAHRVYRQLAAAEPIDFYPLLRPFGLGLAILLFPVLIGVLNGVLQPTVSATGAMVKGSELAISRLLKAKEAALKKSRSWQMYVGESGSGDREKWYRYTFPKDPDGNGEGFLDRMAHDLQFFMDKQMYGFRHSIKTWMKEVLEVVYAAAALCINTLRTFFLIVLAILGPLVLGFAVYDGLQHTLSVWLARYINIFLWLPIANIFGSILGKIQENMLKLDISQIEGQGDTFFSGTDTAYLIFLIIGIVGYFCVPTVASFVVHAGGGNSILSKVNAMTVALPGRVAGGAIPAAKAAGGALARGMQGDSLGDQYRYLNQGMVEAESSDYFRDRLKGGDK